MPLIVLVWVLLAPDAAGAQRIYNPLRIYVHSEPSTGTFTEPETVDAEHSAKDIRRWLSDREHTTRFRVLAEHDRADIVLTVVGRMRKTSDDVVGVAVPNGFGGFNAAFVKPRRAYVFVRLTAGEYTREMLGESGTWSNAAADAVKQVRRWADLNRERLIAKRSK